MNNTVKKNLNISLKICTCLLAAFAIFMMVFTVVTVTTVDRNDRSLFGIKFYIVQTDSMKLSENNADLDVHFSSGDIVVIKKVKDFKSLPYLIFPIKWRAPCLRAGAIFYARFATTPLSL